MAPGVIAMSAPPVHQGGKKHVLTSIPSFGLAPGSTRCLPALLLNAASHSDAGGVLDVNHTSALAPPQVPFGRHHRPRRWAAWCLVFLGQFQVGAGVGDVCDDRAVAPGCPIPTVGVTVDCLAAIIAFGLVLLRTHRVGRRDRLVGQEYLITSDHHPAATSEAI